MVKFFLIAWLIIPGHEPVDLANVQVDSLDKCHALAAVTTLQDFVPQTVVDHLADQRHMFGVGCVERYEDKHPI